MKKSKLLRIILHPVAALVSMLDSARLGRAFSDAVVLKCRYWMKFGEKLNLEDPKNFNQKLHWIKLFDRKPLYTTLTDKYAVRAYIAEKAGGQYLIPLLWVGERFDDIDFESLPDQFVIKCTHDCGSVVICKDKHNFDRGAARRKITKALGKNWYFNHSGRQWQYKDIPPKIIIEQYLAPAGGGDPSDFKVFCFNGEPKCIGVFSDRFKDGLKVTLFDMAWQPLPISTDGRHATLPPKPDNFEEMVAVSKALSKDAHFVRVDLYAIDHRIYVGELTLTPANGCVRFDSPEWNTKFGDWLTLPKNHYEH